MMNDRRWIVDGGQQRADSGRACVARGTCSRLITRVRGDVELDRRTDLPCVVERDVARTLPGTLLEEGQCRNLCGVAWMARGKRQKVKDEW